ncbi:MAG: uracil-DNA glycosylase family protein [Sutterella sp.]|nr:uracil-DNA glycosylase family protein [Sutterella sp.]
MLSADDSRLWEALEIGPQWLLRETPDPLLPETSLVRPAPAGQRPVQPASESAVRRPAPPAPVRRTVPVRAQTSETMTAPVASAPAPQISQTALDADTLAKIPTADWETLRTLAEKCACCRMAKSRQHMVYAEGGPGVRIAIVGEAPGSEEDLQGIPFVGKSGQLLTQMLESLGITRKKDTVILNVLKCRPPGNRNPMPEEVACCEHYLRRQLELVAPDVLLIMGRFAVQTLLRTTPDQSIGSQRGRVHTVECGGRSVRAVVTYHPSYLLRSPDQKAKAWEDLLLFRRTLHEAGIDMPARTKQWL